VAQYDGKCELTLNDINRAQLALFAARAASAGAALEVMKMIALCVRNRVRQGWHDGQWLTVMEHADEAEANLPGPRVYLDPNQRPLQRMMADVDDIYYGQRDESRDERRQGAKQPVAQNFAPAPGSL
jgi:hypothetical protein